MPPRDRSAAGRDPESLEARSRRLGERIQQLREARRWTQEHLAELVGCHRTTVGRLEAGLNKHGQPSNPQLEMIWDLADAFGIEPGELLRP